MQYIKHIKDHLMISYDKDLIIDFNANNETFMEGIQTLTKISLFYNKMRCFTFNTFHVKHKEKI